MPNITLRIYFELNILNNQIYTNKRKEYECASRIGKSTARRDLHI